MIQRLARSHGGWSLAVAALAAIVVACSPAHEAIPVSGEHDGLTLTGGVTNTGHSIAVDVVLRNERDEPVVVVPDQCGRVVDVELERTVFRPEGKRWDASIQAVKDQVMQDQQFLDRPDSFAPRRVGDSSSAVPTCARPEHLTTLGAGDEIAERWELPFEDSLTLREVGSESATVTLESVEARDPDDLEYLDILPATAEDAARQGRSVRAELPLAKVLQRAPSEPATGATYGELFDRLMADDGLRTWIEAQPADVWRSARLTPSFNGSPLQLRLPSAAFERAAVVTAAADGSHPVVDLPGDPDRIRVFRRTDGTLPPGVQALPDSDYEVTQDLHLGEVLLPSGKAIVGEFLFDEEPLPLQVAPGPYPANATLVQYRDDEFESVALASLVLSDAPTVRWEDAGAIAVDGGTATITSVEGRDELTRLMDDDPRGSDAVDQATFDSLMAHDYLGTEWPIGRDTNLVRVASGNGDGVYPVYVGYDVGGNPTRVVVDFLLLHLGWPGT